METNEENDLLNCIRIEIKSIFEPNELSKFKNFDDFYSEIDVYNAYEPDWDKNDYEIYYRVVWLEHLYERLTEKYSQLIVSIGGMN